MKRYVPKDKLSKKARRELDKQKRLTWPKCPATMVFADKKKNGRKRETCDWSSWDESQVFLHGAFPRTHRR